LILGVNDFTLSEYFFLALLFFVALILGFSLPRVIKSVSFFSLRGKKKECLEKNGSKGDGRNFKLCSAMQAHLAIQTNQPLLEIAELIAEIRVSSSIKPDIDHKLQKITSSTLVLNGIYSHILAAYEQGNYLSSINLSSYQAEHISNAAVFSFRSQLGASHLQLNYAPICSSLMIWVDYKKIEFVLSCILSYLFRSCDYRGTIDFTVQEETIDEKQYCCYEITADSESVDRLSDEVVSYVDEIVKLHHGVLKMEVLSDGRYICRLCILLGKSHFNNQLYVTFLTTDPAQEEMELRDSLSQESLEKRVVEVDNCGKPKLVVIEDNEHNRYYLKILLSKEYDVSFAENGELGIQLVNEKMPELVLSDVMMPVMDGFDCCKALKENLDTCHIPIILLTALNDDKDVVKGLEIGADDYILKPFKSDILLTKIRRLIRTRRELKTFYSSLVMPSLDEEPQLSNSVDFPQNPFITRLLEIVATNLQNPEFSAKQLAEMVSMSQPTLYRKVKQITGFTIIELIRGVRLKESVQLLIEKQYSIQEVAERVGYNDIPTFRKHFVELYGVTPSIFAKRHIS
ncbi:MAG: response regulator, partial [Phocaeicola sp.]